MRKFLFFTELDDSNTEYMSVSMISEKGETSTLVNGAWWKSGVKSKYRQLSPDDIRKIDLCNTTLRAKNLPVLSDNEINQMFNSEA